jgi:hypothetical protein
MADIFEPLRAPIIAAVSNAVGEAFDEIEMEPLFDILQSIVDTTNEPFWVGAGKSEAEINISLCGDEGIYGDYVITSKPAALSDVAWFWPDCWRSQASIIFALEASVANMRKRFEEEFEMPFDRAELERQAVLRFPSDKFPRADHKFWPDNIIPAKDQTK